MYNVRDVDGAAEGEAADEREYSDFKRIVELIGKVCEFLALLE